jgi:cyclase
MLKVRLIPVLVLKNGRMIKTVKFGSERDVGDPVSATKIYNAQNVDELIFLDITASQEKRQNLFEMIFQRFHLMMKSI